jgi:predicted ATPase/DNA-binding SARP family transcriptional activator
MAQLTLCTLGSFTLTLDGAVLRGFESDKVRALLAYLAVESDRAHWRDKLATLFWSDMPDAQAHANFNQALYNLRSLLGERQATHPFLIVTRQTVQFNPQSSFQSDVHNFGELLEECQRHAHPRLDICAECANRLERLVALYQGDFLEGFNLPDAIPFEEWAVTRRERLHQQFLTVLAGLAIYHESQGETALALKYARRLVKTDPLGEAGQRSLMRLLALNGQRESALGQYLSFHNLLNEELAVEPEPETRALYARLRLETQDTHPPLDSLPAHLTPFIGRQAELAELSALLRDPGCRLVTVLGAGGSGKTRLALQAASRLSYHFADGVFFVPLSSLPSIQALLPSIALALGFKFQDGSDPQPQLLDYLRGKQVLLLLDSFEVVPEAAGWLSDLLRAAPQVKELVTSRVRLNVKGEQIFFLGGMRYPEPEKTGEAGFDLAQYSAMQLFLAGAKSTQANLGWGKDSWRDLAKICRLVQGMPLGLLLASAWVDDYTPAEIAAEIEHSLDFLESRWVDVPERQRSLRATLEYSWRTLSPPEQELFCELSVFQGGFTRQAAGEVSQAPVWTLQSLVDKSLVNRAAYGRYQIHDLVRQYAEQKLGESEEVEREARDRHSAFYLDRMARWEGELKSARQRQVLEEIDGQISDVQVGWLWAAGQAQTGRLAGALEGLGTYYELRQRYMEGKESCQAALDGLAGGEEPGAVNLRGCLRAWQARFCRLLGEVEQAQELREASRAMLERAAALGEDARRGWALLGHEMGYAAGSLREHVDWLQRSAASYQALDDAWRRAEALTWAGELACRLGDRARGLEFLQEAVALSRTVGEPLILARTLHMLALQTLVQGQWEIGVRLMEEAGGYYRASGDAGQEAIANLHLGVMRGWTGRFVDGMELLEKALPVLKQIGNRYYTAYGTLGMGVWLMHIGEYQEAERTIQAALEAARKDGYAREIASSLTMLGCLELIRGQPDQAQSALQESVERYRLLSAAGEIGMALGGLALAELALGRRDAAHTALKEALGFAVETHSHFTTMTNWAALVALLADTGRWEQALEVYSAGQGVPMLTNSRWQAEMVAPWIAAALAHLPPDAVEAAQERGQGRDLFATVEELLSQLPPAEAGGLKLENIECLNY